jgi:peptidoglycan/xylan/chitin deacetylase (PgdA/CDA1 family)
VPGADGASVPDAGGSADGAAPTSPSSDLLIPPGAGNQPRPSGGAANLEVLPWAGFEAALTYTFDDTQPSQIDHIADIEGAGIPVTFYVTIVNDWYSGYVSTWQAVRAAGHELGNHTVNHCAFNLTSCAAPLATPEAELDQCTSYMQSTLGAPAPLTMAYPYGDTGYEPDARSRFLLARGSAAGYVLPEDATDPHDLPAFVASATETADALDAVIDTGQKQGAWTIFVFHSLLPDSANWYNGVDVSAVTASIGHAKSLDVWIDTLAHVGEYWLGQKAVTTGTTTTSNGATTWSWTLPARYPPGRFVRVKVGGGTLWQNGIALTWSPHGYYEVALDAGTLRWTP